MLKHFTTMLPFKHKWLNFKVSFKLHLFKFLGFKSRRNRCEGLRCLCRLKVFLVLLFLDLKSYFSKNSRKIPINKLFFTECKLSS